MSVDDLSAPLGQEKPRRKRLAIRVPVTAMQALAGVLGLFLLGFLGIALFNDNPFGGEPLVRVAINPASLPAEPVSRPAGEAKAPEAAKTTQAPPTDTGRKTVTIIDGSSGARREVPIGSGGGGGGGSEPGKDGGGVSAPPVRLEGINQKLLENSRHGMIPIIADGLKPYEAYAAGTPLDRARAAKIPSIAIVVAGLGVGAAKTNDAIMKLPGAVTLAFTPYGSDPSKLVERARAQKHEVLLQIPMEPFDYPDNDPGPQTLLTTLGGEQNIDRLHWHLSRFQGYVGLANFMGARFVATDAAMQPVLREAAKRGLAWLDDGSSPRTVAGAAADTQAVPFAKADVSLDAVPTAAEIDRALARLESIAREKGSAVGVASALPVSIDRIGAWTKALEGRGFLLVPLTTVMQKTKSS